MEPGMWISCEKTAVLHGGFLLAEKLYRPKELAALNKSEWHSVGKPIVQAVQEILSDSSLSTRDVLHWEKKIICILWTRLLDTENSKREERDSGENTDRKWKEDPTFSVQNLLPSISPTVLFELVKSMGCARVFAQFLSAFPGGALCGQLAGLVEHVLIETSEEDVQFLLEVWWELWKSPEEKPEDGIVQAFAAQAASYLSQLPAPSAKRFKPDPDVARQSCVVSLLLDALRKTAECFSTSDLCCLALSNCLDMLYTSFLLDCQTRQPVEEHLQSLARAVQLRRLCSHRQEENLAEDIREAQREVAAAHTPSQFKPTEVTLPQGLKALLELVEIWGKKELLTISADRPPSPAAYRLKSCLPRVISSLEELPLSEEVVSEGERGIVRELSHSLTSVREGIALPELECGGAELARVAAAVIDNRLGRFQEVTHVFASSLVFNVNEWTECLERNKPAFRNEELVLKLVSTLTANTATGTQDVSQQKRLKGIILDIFSELPLPLKNSSLARALSAFGRKGLHGVLPRTVMEGFSDEVNLAFNCITQSKTPQSLDSAVSAVARVAFQNPEAVLQRVCHLAVVNLGAHRLLADILKNLPGLIYYEPSGLQSDSSAGCSLLCHCLKDTVWGKLSSAKEEDQFFHFLAFLMQPSSPAGDEPESRLCFLQPGEVTRTFVLPHLMDSNCNLELCLRVLQQALQHRGPQASGHWVMSCPPFPLLFSLCQLLHNSFRCWQDPVPHDVSVSLEAKELLTNILAVMCDVVGKEVAADPSTWSRALYWLYNKVEALDWTVRFQLKGVWREHFKNEVPLSMMEVCSLSEDKWAGLDLPMYGLGTGLLAWMECCCLSADVQTHMLENLMVDMKNAEEVNMFSKGFMVALIQVLPWCTSTEWGRVMEVARHLLQTRCLHVPYSLEYVEFMPLLNLRHFSGDLQLSMLLLRAFQLLCGSSCSDWLPQKGWLHVGRLYAGTMRGILESVTGKLLPSGQSEAPASDSSHGSQEVVFVFVQLFCHLLHVAVMMPAHTYEPLYLAVLEILTQYEAVLKEHPASFGALYRDNTKHFLHSIAQNLPDQELRSTVQQKISRL
ncbi:gem-associated protein 4 isoform X1 [Lepisosteus oculatus]|uniref:gem-associated protein 4 isoform X1 n=2 Tax=Lepisosteus oculatus TaxID=7918 RepID=UPI003710B4C1